MPAKVDFYFSGDTVRQIMDDLIEYGTEGTIITLGHDGEKKLIRVVGPEGDGGDPLDDATNCPGGPRC